jgi:hypothetical protein
MQGRLYRVDPPTWAPLLGSSPGCWFPIWNQKPERLLPTLLPVVRSVCVSGAAPTRCFREGGSASGVVGQALRQERVGPLLRAPWVRETRWIIVDARGGLDA